MKKLQVTKYPLVCYRLRQIRLPYGIFKFQIKRLSWKIYVSSKKRSASRAKQKTNHAVGGGVLPYKAYTGCAAGQGMVLNLPVLRDRPFNFWGGEVRVIYFV